jgi:hypothetical protein
MYDWSIHWVGTNFERGARPYLSGDLCKIAAKLPPGGATAVADIPGPGPVFRPVFQQGSYARTRHGEDVHGATVDQNSSFTT